MEESCWWTQGCIIEHQCCYPEQTLPLIKWGGWLGQPMLESGERHWDFKGWYSCVACPLLALKLACTLQIWWSMLFHYQIWRFNTWFDWLWYVELDLWTLFFASGSTISWSHSDYYFWISGCSLQVLCSVGMVHLKRNDIYLAHLCKLRAFLIKWSEIST